MKLNHTITLALLILGLSMNAAAEGPGDRHGRFAERGGHPATEAVQKLTRAFRRLDLSEEQKVHMRGELDAMREQLKPLVQSLAEGRQEMADLVFAEEYDEDRAAEIAAQQAELGAEVALIVNGTMAGLVASLDEGQRAELEAMRESHLAHRAEMRERRKAHREHRRAFRNRDRGTD